MDNQQGTLTLTDIGWLAGIIDGEGCIGLMRSLRRGTKLQYEPRIMITNTDYAIIEKAARILSAMGVGHHISTRSPKKKRKVYNINVLGFKRNATLLSNIWTYLTGAKRERGLLILAFIQHRSRQRRAAPYTEVEEAIYEAIKACTAVSLPPRDQMPDAIDLAKLESELHGDMQRQAEMTCSPVVVNFGWKETWKRCEKCGESFRLSPIYMDRIQCCPKCRKTTGH